ncbi:MAG: aminotransferase class III-fold pyridoxal phosphate-dependent enzyme [Alphaproteobacteria bacterium]
MSVAVKTANTEASLLDRAQAVIPGGMYGHQTRARLWPGAPQFLEKGEGAYIWDTDGNRYIDLLCSYGPIVLGHRHPAVEAAAARQLRHADCQNSPSPLIVDLAERLVSIVDHAQWAIFMKNGTDATTLALTVARAATGRKKILVAKGAYHGAAAWCNPNTFGIPEAERANLVYYAYNDIASVDAALDQAGNDLAGIITSPFKHDAGLDQALVDPAFARHLRAACDARDAMLILDDVRCGFRMAFGGSWEPIGVEPDLSAWSKAIANGYPLAALLGNDRVRDAASKIYATGSFWFSAVPMAAALATLDVLEKDDGVRCMRETGEAIMAGLAGQAASLGLKVNVTGHPALPYLKFANETEWRWTTMFAGECARLGLYTHPRHNWFISTAITDELVATILSITERAFAAVKRAGAA